MSSPRTIAIGDIHGCDCALEILLGELAPFQADDEIVVLGDVIDRGPNTKRCIELLLELRTQCRMVHLMGNHEEMFFDAMMHRDLSHGWFSYGGKEMLASYGGQFDFIPESHLNFLRNGREYHENDNEIFVHGFIRWDSPPDIESARWLRWSRIDPNLPPHKSGKRIICGHTAQKEGRPLVTPHAVCIDTCAYCERGRLSALILGEDLLIQSNQAGQLWPAVPLA